MNPFSLLAKYHDPVSSQYQILVVHSVLVANKALELADHLEKNKIANPDRDFIYEASMCHDIGFGFPGELPIKKSLSDCYVCHGYYGAEILRKEGFPLHARLAERHVGMGILACDIKKNHWPIPEADYRPETWEEKIVTYADLFFSKKPKTLFTEEPMDQAKRQIAGYDSGEEKLRELALWEKEFSIKL